ncbi:golgin subfamily A member 4-like [Ostrinia furnacalis]|uniref:golgin subfamily A member 4-like n=1 Tax=Ostrinia furnacalis TaxID=93504 RepID=UPI001040A24B|nr:golgin subfamily A member 4-like [Ostrinia furnacalis]
MFKKLKDKLAEEVKSSPQRIQQFAQAAQAAVTSASSSISDITNSDLFSIGDNENQSNQTLRPSTSTNQTNSFQEVSLMQPGQSSESMNFAMNHEDNQRQRRLSNSSFTSDISFRLPSYESPSMYHLQSDMEVSASEAEERGFSTGAVSLDRVTKEQLYAAYRRTQERYTKYRTQYADLARHYKLLERENAKARSVLVETQDKALRRISELREQCSLEQSAKAHLEKALRVDIEERNMKIEALNTKISLLQNIGDSHNQPATVQEPVVEANKKDQNDVQLINLSPDTEDIKPSNNEGMTTYDVGSVSNKIEKMEQLLNKYKESLKSSKEKNSQLTTELKKISTELENQIKENEKLKAIEPQLIEKQQQIQELTLTNEELHNKVNTYDFAKTKELSTLEMDLLKSKEEIEQLQGKIEIFSKREEEYAISLAENKLSIHKELESKEAEIKSLKDHLSAAKKELQSLNIIVNDYKTSIAALEEERSKLNNEVNESNLNKAKITEMESQILVLSQKCQSLEQTKVKSEEEIKCLQLQMKQETAEKLAMIDRNSYLENRNSLLIEENTKKSSQVSHLEKEIVSLKKENASSLDETAQKQLLDEIEFWKAKFNNLESEIQDERVELVKLQSEIEKLLRNHELVQSQNSELHDLLEEIKKENSVLRQNVSQNEKTITNWGSIAAKVKELQNSIKLISDETRSFKAVIADEIISEISKNVASLDAFSKNYEILKNNFDKLENDHNSLQKDAKSTTEKLSNCQEELNAVKDENEILTSKIQLNASEKLELQQELQNTVGKCNVAADELNSVKNDKQIMIQKLEEVESKCLQLQTAIDHDNNQCLEALEKLKVIQDEKQTLTKKLDKIEKENVILNTEVEKRKVRHRDDVLLINLLNSEKEELLQALEEKQGFVVDLDEMVTELKKENSSLQKQCENIANNVKDLELELNEVRKSHADMEQEKDRLSSVIEILEKKEQAKELINKDIQTEINIQTNTNSSSTNKDNDEIMSLLNNIDELNIKNSKYEEDITSLKEANTQLTNRNAEITEENLQKVNEITSKCNELQNDYDAIKEENRRLQSDVEGLQSYLAKISKENGVLNDKLRELIASSENTARTDYQASELLELQNEALADKEKIDDLTRENSLLLEENLELKDQLQSQNYAETKKSTNNNDTDTVTIEKYNSLLGTKHNLEEKLITLEQMNRSMNGNMQQIQGNNEKLKLTNEKLERRLDEALVSLRHLHSLQENTELEYLKNILYEYLTGSGTHSVTLAKVLAAVVKFDDKQTQQVLQKEKERQGILRQLGLL